MTMVIQRNAMRVKHCRLSSIRRFRECKPCPHLQCNVGFSVWRGPMATMAVALDRDWFMQRYKSCSL